jgi:hypothetical protein
LTVYLANPMSKKRVQNTKKGLNGA